MDTTTKQIHIRNRLSMLRMAMSANGIEACIVPSADPHQSEYMADHWKMRAWLSGFTGSAGTLVVALREACLWTDSRYFLQAEQEVDAKDIAIQKEKMPGTPTVEEWLCKCLPEKSAVGIDASVFSIRQVEKLQEKLQAAGISLHTDFDAVSRLWTDRPPIPESPVFVLPEMFSGEAADRKIGRLRETLRQDGCNAILLCAPDEIAWMFNIRGNDIPCNPVAIAYALITSTEAIIFIDRRKIGRDVSTYFHRHHVRVADYDALPEYLAGCGEALKIRLDAEKTNYRLYDAIRKLPERGHSITCSLQDASSPVALMKAVKNDTEIAGFRKAAEKDGVALVQLLMWLEQSMLENTPVTETGVEKKIQELRGRQALYAGESFEAIVAWGKHAAIVHYHASADSDEQIRPDSLLLMDTGGQYSDGTTDITRTIAPGNPSPAMRHDFTLVLKGHIAIATARFPQGTRGAQLDILARNPLWQEGLSYLHGTGHGIGHFLCVHEGPQSIRIEENPTPLQPGMVVSNEPGIYRAGEYGIRIENMVLVREDMETGFGKFYGFETLSLCPIDLRLVEADMLTDAERGWLNSYHQAVYERLSPGLSDEERQWLKEKTNEV
jgi:Xaa-Pro aminopeptidase